jgi:P-type Mg2+ transporter
LPGGFFAALGGMVICYLALIEIGKRVFYGATPPVAPTPPRYSPHRHLRRRAAYFSTATRRPGLSSTKP